MLDAAAAIEFSSLTNQSEIDGGRTQAHQASKPDLTWDQCDIESAHHALGDGGTVHRQ